MRREQKWSEATASLPASSYRISDSNSRCLHQCARWATSSSIPWRTTFSLHGRYLSSLHSNFPRAAGTKTMARCLGSFLALHRALSCCSVKLDSLREPDWREAQRCRTSVKMRVQPCTPCSTVRTRSASRDCSALCSDSISATPRTECWCGIDGKGLGAVRNRARPRWSAVRRLALPVAKCARNCGQGKKAREGNATSLTRTASILKATSSRALAGLALPTPIGQQRPPGTLRCRPCSFR